jgi:hypothetical protein
VRRLSQSQLHTYMRPYTVSNSKTAGLLVLNPGVFLSVSLSKSGHVLFLACPTGHLLVVAILEISDVLEDNWTPKGHIELVQYRF